MDLETPIECRLDFPGRIPGAGGGLAGGHWKHRLRVWPCCNQAGSRFDLLCILLVMGQLPQFVLSLSLLVRVFVLRLVESESSEIRGAFHTYIGRQAISHN